MSDEDPFDPGPAYERLVQDLDHPAARVRRGALKGLWSHPRGELLERIFHLARRDGAPSVRRQAVMLLGRYLWEGEEAHYDFPVPYAEPAISREDWRRAERFLVDYATDEAIGWGLRRFAIEALGFSAQPRAHRLIEQALRHPDLKVRQSAIFAMGRGGWQRWVEPLLKLLRSDLPRPLLLETIRAVGDMGIEEAGRELLRLTYHDDPEIAAEAVWGLRTISGPEVFGRLDELADFGPGKLRKVAGETLDEWLTWESLAEEAELDWDQDEELDPFDRRSSLEELVDELDHPQARVRREALSRLWIGAARELMDRILHMARHDRARSVRREALAVLGHCLWATGTRLRLPPEDVRRVEDFLIAYAGDETLPWPLRRHAVEALAHSARSEVERIVRAALEHPDPHVRASGVRAAARRSGGPEVLVRLLRAPQEKPVLLEAVEAAGDLALEEAAQDILRLSRHPDPDVACEAVWALRQLEVEGVLERLEELVVEGRGRIRRVAGETMTVWTQKAMEGDWDPADWDAEEPQDGPGAPW